MLKHPKHLAVGDWVVTDSLIVSRFIGSPWQVTKMAGSRVYLERRRMDPVTKKLEVCEEKYVALKSVRYVFTDEASATAASDYARVASEAYEKRLRELQAEHRQAFLARMAALPVAPSTPADAG